MPTYDHDDHTETVVAGGARDRELRAAGHVPVDEAPTDVVTDPDDTFSRVTHLDTED